eukprot:3484401-Rhodomonas_salina.2
MIGGGGGRLSPSSFQPSPPHCPSLFAASPSNSATSLRLYPHTPTQSHCSPVPAHTAVRLAAPSLRTHPSRISITRAHTFAPPRALPSLYLRSTLPSLSTPVLEAPYRGDSMHVGVGLNQHPCKLQTQRALSWQG